MNILKANFQFGGQEKKRPACDVNTSDIQDEDDDFFWSDSEFSDDETNENGYVPNDSNPLYHDITEHTYQDGGATTEDYYMNYTSAFSLPS